MACCGGSGTAGTASMDFPSLTPSATAGAYVVQEVGLPTGFVFVSLVCSVDGGGGSTVVTGGQRASITIAV